MHTQINLRVKESSEAGAGYYGYMHYSLYLEKSSQPSLCILALFVHEGSSLPAAVWSCCAENPTLFTPVNNLVFRHLKAVHDESSKTHTVWDWVLLKPCFVPQKSDLSFLASVPLLMFLLGWKKHVMVLAWLDWLASWALVYTIQEDQLLSMLALESSFSPAADL